MNTRAKKQVDWQIKVNKINQSVTELWSLVPEDITKARSKK